MMRMTTARPPRSQLQLLPDRLSHQGVPLAWFLHDASRCSWSCDQGGEVLEFVLSSDIKPEKILLDSAGHVKTTDFGLSVMNIFGDKKISEYAGTLRYMAPEIFLDALQQGS
ncbi:sperm motility kinase-like [Rhinoderma darwinii]|uniref:sperm motility kinase-like n=1 Tax=Rhinoderma darwinii TaxID=43563 RepID=UPI003F680E10